MMTQKQFQEEFGGMMLHGLNSRGTYISLRTNKSTGINVAIRPIVERLSEGVVLFGGKLRVGYTMDKKHNPLKATATSISSDAAAERLKDFCKGFTWIRADERRFSTVIGVGIAATRYDGDKAVSAIEEKGLAAEFLNSIEKKYKQYNDVGFTANKRKAIRALNAAWAIQSKRVFSEIPVAVQLPDDVVGMKSGVLNKAQEGYGGNVVSFQKKVAELAAETESNSD